MYEKLTAPTYDLAAIEPLKISPWLAMSLLHKSVRRKRPEWALKAAAALYQTSPQRLTRRLCVIAFEDVGLADLNLVRACGFAINCTDASTLAQLVVSMASTTSCRAADDLFVICEHWPALDPLRKELSNFSIAQLLSRADGQEDVIQKALCLRFAFRSELTADRLQVFAWLRARGLSSELTHLCERGYKATREPLCALFGLLQLYHSPESSAALSDPMPPEQLVAGIPCWAYDIHVREGRKALANLLAGRTKTSRWCRAHVASSQRIDFLGGVLFRIESGLVANRLNWPLATKLRQVADLECHGVDPLLGSQISELLLSDLPCLNEERRHVVRS